MQTRNLKRELAGALFSLFAAGVAVQGATYAWFINNTQVTGVITSITPSTSHNILLTEGTKDQDDTGDTGKKENISYDEAASAVWSNSVLLQAGNGLTPVSTLGTRLTENNGTDGFAGDARFVTSTRKWEQNRAVEFREVYRNDTSDAGGNYFYEIGVWLKPAQACKLYLDGATYQGSDGATNSKTGINWQNYQTQNGGSGWQVYSFEDFQKLAPVVDATNTAEAAAYNLQLSRVQALVKTLRLGFMVSHYTTEGEATGEPKFFVYALDDTELDETNSVNTTKLFEIDSDNDPETPDDTVVVDGVATAMGYSTDDAATGQWGYGDTTRFDSVAAGGSIPLLDDCTAIGKDEELADVSQSSQCLADATANEQVRVDIYLWMEGCDFDTTAGNLEKFSTGQIPSISIGFCIGDAEGTVTTPPAEP